MLVYLNGRLVPREKAVVSVFDHGFLYGDGIYETLRAYEGKLFLLDNHLARLKHSADAIALTLPMSLGAIGEALNETVKANRLDNAYVRIQISRGPGEIGLDPSLCPEPTLVIVAKPYTGPPPEVVDRGVAVAVVNTRRNHPLALDPSIKGTNFLNNILAKSEALKANAYEGIMLNWEGYVAEGATSNVFIVQNGTLRTPSLDVGILAGVTRGLVLDLAGRAGISVQESAFGPEDLAGADECLITSSIIEILPVTAVDGKPVGTGAPGPVTAALREAYRKEVSHG